MHRCSRSARVIGAAASVFLLYSFICNFAYAGDLEYSQIGWWRVIYRDTGTQVGCQAEARFNDQTEIAMALIQEGSGSSWFVFVSNPKWDAWITRRSQHTVTVAEISPNKTWRGPWGVVNGSALVLNASIDFVNSIADAKQLAIFDDTGRLLTAWLDMTDSEAAIKAVVHCAQQYPPASSSVPEAQRPPEEPVTSFSGTAFFIAPNLLLTNNHVIKQCRNSIQVRYPDQTPFMATLQGQDDTNDLALLHTEMSSRSIGSFRIPARLGEAVATYGFPYSDLLSSSGNFTLGSVTSLSGLRNDSRFLQIQAPVQPGNSGGPLLDMSGSIIGVVAGRLDAMVMIEGGGGVPQNINFAIQGSIVVNFLSSKGVTPKLDSSEARRVLPSADVADLAKNFTVQVTCEAAPPRTSKAAPGPQMQTTAIEQNAREFVLSLEAKWSRPNTEALAGLDGIYAGEVMYYGKLTKKDNVIKEKSAFVRKFPQREYRPREPVFVSCRDQVCTVRGLLDFRAVDPVAKIVSEGVASFEYQLTLSGDSVKINLENGEVLKRSRTPLALMSKSDAFSGPAEAARWQRSR